MTDTPAEVVPEPTELERVAQLAAEAAVRARPDLAPQLRTLEARVAEILEALTAAAGPEGNAARLAARLEQVEAQLEQLTGAPPAPHPEQQKLLDNVHQRLAAVERKTR